MKIVFWNLRNIFNADLITLLIETKLPDIFIFAEANRIAGNLENLLSTKRYNRLFSVNSKLLYFTSYDRNLFIDVNESRHISIKKYNPPIGYELLIVALHLPSKLFMNEDDQRSYAQRISEIIEEFENTQKTANTLLIGDFNMNPFEKGMIAHRGFNSTFFSSIAAEEVKKHNEMERKYFYNPSLALYNDLYEGKGTYYKKVDKEIEYYWYLFDQILIRPALIAKFNKDSLEILTRIGEYSLMNRNGIPNKKISDHLPLLCELLN